MFLELLPLDPQNYTLGHPASSGLQMGILFQGHCRIWATFFHLSLKYSSLKSCSLPSLMLDYHLDYMQLVGTRHDFFQHDNQHSLLPTLCLMWEHLTLKMTYYLLPEMDKIKNYCIVGLWGWRSPDVRRLCKKKICHSEHWVLGDFHACIWKKILRKKIAI